MRLLLPSLFLALYSFFRLIWPLPLRPAFKIFAGASLLAVSMKYLIYEILGGSFFAPELPESVLLFLEALYGSLFILVFFIFIKDISALLLYFARMAGLAVHMPFSTGIYAVIFIPLSLGIGTWGTWSSIQVPAVKTVHINLEGLPAELEGFTLAQLSDIHIGSLLRKDWLKKTVERTNAVYPDIVVITGDLIDKRPHELKDQIEPLKELRAQYGVYGVNGNHEYYYDASGWLYMLRSLGIDMLINEHRELPYGLILGGIPDSAALRFGLEGPNIAKTFEKTHGLRILLSHQPRMAKALEAHKVALQLSGHTHGGLLFFLAPLIAQFNEGFVNGLYRMGKSQLYVNPGSGLWSGFSCRIGVPAEITKFILHSEHKQERTHY